MELANLIISTLSLFATIAISIIIYYLERRNQKEARNKEIKEAAKRFIIENASELDYLHWATIAVGCFPQNKHVRKIYNAFAFLDDETKLEVLKQRELDCKLLDSSDWIHEKIDLIQKIIQELGIGNDFLYDNGKYFTRAYRYKKYSVKDLMIKRYENDKYEDLFQLARAHFKNEGKLTYEQYLEDFLYCKFEKPNLMPKDVDIPLPNDYLIAVENLRNCDEIYLCYWMMVMVENVISYAIRYLNYKDNEPSETDAQAETYEDMYFSILYELYYLQDKNE